MNEILQWFVGGYSVFPHAYPIEMMQLIAALMGECANLLTVWEASKDRKFVRKYKINGQREFTAARNLFEERARLFINTMFVTIGITSILSPPPIEGFDSSNELYFQLALSRTAITLASLAMMTKSIRDYLDRKKLRVMFEAEGSPILETVKTKAQDIVTVIETAEKGKRDENYST